MKQSVRKLPVTIGASLVFFGLCGSLSAIADNSAQSSDDKASCREVTKRVAVWHGPGNPKFTNPPRFEDRVVVACDSQTVAKAEGQKK